MLTVSPSEGSCSELRELTLNMKSIDEIIEQKGGDNFIKWTVDLGLNNVIVISVDISTLNIQTLNIPQKQVRIGYFLNVCIDIRPEGSVTVNPKPQAN